MEKVKKTKDTSNFIKVLKVIEAILMVVILFICTVIVTQRITGNKTAFLGFRIFRVETGSMIPKYNIADVILVKEKPIDKIVVGDDLVYSGEKGNTRGKTITHRVIRIEEDENGEKVFYTKGIANKKEDPAVYSKQIMGTVKTKLYVITLIMNLLLNRYTLYFIIILPATFYIFFSEFHGRERRIRQDIRKRNKKAQEKEEKEKAKQKARDEKAAQRRIGTREQKRLGNKESAEETSKTEKKTKTKQDK